MNAGAGMDALVVESPEAYVERAVELARSPAQLAEIRATLERTRSMMPMFDVPRFTRHLEAAFETMVEGARRGLLPEGFDVPPLSREGLREAG